MKFRIGDEVKCVDDSPPIGKVYKVLEKGRVYTVEGIASDSAIFVGTTPDGWKNDRFEKVGRDVDGAKKKTNVKASKKASEFEY